MIGRFQGFRLSCGPSIAASAIFLASMPAYAEEAAYSLNIPAQDLDRALRTLARATHMQITFDAALLSGKRTQALKGSYTPRTALGLLLKDTGLVGQTGSSGLIIIRPAPAHVPAALSAPAAGRARAAQPSNNVPHLSPAADDAQTSNIADIIVTAQKRAERLQDVPISVSAFNAQQLQTQQINTTSDLAQMTPSLTMSEQSNVVLPFIRGVGSTAIIPGEVGSISTYIDGVFMPSPFGASYELANIESVQVLKGPQGTLFGRNTAGGAIILNTDQPGFTWKGKLSAQYGNYDSRKVGAYVNGPVSDRVAISLLGSYEKDDGYLHDIIHNERTGELERTMARGSILFRATDNLTLTINADYAKNDDNSGISQQPRNGYQGKTAITPNPTGFYDVALNTEASARIKQYGGSLHIDWDAGPVRVVSITAKRKNRYAVRDYDTDVTPIKYQTISFDEYSDNFSQELQIISNGDGAFKWVVGGFYSNQDAGWNDLSFNGAIFRTNTNAKALAVFADGTYTLGDFKFTGGIRYNIDRLTYTGSLNGVLRADDFKKKYTSATPRAVLSYHPSRDVLAYASYSKGFKSGTFSQTAFSRTPIDPERINAYELGLKLQPVPWLTANAAVYLYDIKGLVVQSQDPVTNLQVLQNAASARTKGFEFEATIRPIPRLDINAGVSYLDAKYRDFDKAQAFVPRAAGLPPLTPDGTGNMSVSVNASGNRVVRSPKWTFNVGASWTIDLPSGGSVVPSAHLFHTSAFFFDAINRLKQDAYTLVNAQIEWRLPGDRFTIAAYGKNLGGTKYLDSFGASTFTDRAVPGSPRTYGVRVGYKF
ncbi:TonB-dependent receptor [Sphingobium sp. AN558]|uniref:TonB-dependent receptor domain-containing protein n=1 Tax=Sphingobium sp. AN558 TaxID=3133442 RepID=UPI0030C4BF78